MKRGGKGEKENGGDLSILLFMGCDVVFEVSE